MKNERVVVIGGSSSMGLTSARPFTAEGYAVVISARNRERVAQALATIGSGATGFPLDCADRASIAVFSEAVGPFDHLLLVGAGPAHLDKLLEKADRLCYRSGPQGLFLGHEDRSE